MTNHFLSSFDDAESFFAGGKMSMSVSLKISLTSGIDNSFNPAYFCKNLKNKQLQPAHFRVLIPF